MSGPMVRVALLVVLLALLAGMPRLIGEPYVIHVLVLACIWTIPAIGLNLMLGYTGLVSLGHMAFAGVGGYTAAILMVDAGWNFWTALVAASVSAGVAGAVIGAICLRFRSHFFMIVTLALGLMLYAVMNNWDEVTRGAAGFAGVPRPAAITWFAEPIRFGPLTNYYYLVLAFSVAAFTFQWLVVRSDLGRALAAIRQDERLARAKGLNVMAYKTFAFAAGSALAGLGGVLYVSFLRVAAPASFNLAESINAVLVVIIGGAGSLIGPALGAIVFVAVPELLRAAEAWRLVIFGAGLVVITLFAPRGLAGGVDWLIARARRRRGAQP